MNGQKAASGIRKREEMDHKRVGIFGAGVIGLSTAYQLLTSRPDLSGKVTVFDRKQPGQSSWAGAGLLPPPPKVESTDPTEQLQRLSLEQFEKWSHDLKILTGIDNGFRRCGGYYLAFSAGEFASLVGLADFWEDIGIEFHHRSLDELAAVEPWVAAQLAGRPPKLIAEIPGETQVRNPWHLKALTAACKKLGAEIVTFPADLELKASLSGSPITAELSGKRWAFDQAVVACGSWTSRFLSDSKCRYQEAGIFPVKGQIVLLSNRPAATDPAFRSILNVGTRYLVPREDGKILIGSTEEEVGFDFSVSEEVRQELLDFAKSVLPKLEDFPVEKQWSGFRPACYHQTPIIGPLLENPNVWVAAGHFRSGIQYSIGTAKCVVSGLLGMPQPIDMKVFSPKTATDSSSSQIC